MSKHTEGLWRAEPMCQYGRDIYANDVWIGQANNSHDSFGDGFPPDDECDANANLIATAPELLEALKGLLEHYIQLVACGDCGNWDAEEETPVIEARAAIAKAEGESRE